MFSVLKTSKNKTIKILVGLLFVALVLFVAFMFNPLEKSIARDGKDTSLWDTLEGTTWRKDNNWAGEGYIFYTDAEGQKRCIHQTYGSGVPVVASEQVDITILDDTRITIGTDTYEYRDKKLVSDTSVLVFDSNEPLAQPNE